MEPLLAGFLDGEAFAPLGPPALDDGPPLFGRHPLAETVVGELLAIRWLKRPFHQFPFNLQNGEHSDLPPISKVFVGSRRGSQGGGEGGPEASSPVGAGTVLVQRPGAPPAPSLTGIRKRRRFGVDGPMGIVYAMDRGFNYQHKEERKCV